MTDPTLNYIVHYFDRRTGDRVAHAYGANIGWHEASEFWWDEGNGSCDCNRDYFDDGEGALPCSYKKNIVIVEKIVTQGGEELYSEEMKEEYGTEADKERAKAEARRRRERRDL